MRSLKSIGQKSFGVLSSLAIAAGASAQDAVQWRVEDGGNGHWYRDDRLPQMLTFEARQANATTRGAHLATITSAAEHQFVLNVAFPTGQIQPNDEWPALGASHLANVKYWSWVTNEPFE